MSTALSTRDHLLAVGLERLRSTGYTATGVKEVLDLALVPKGSFYHYFPSKEEFAVEVFHLYAHGEAERSERVLGDRKVAPLKRLRRYFEELISVYGQSGEISGCLMGSLSLEVADHSPRMRSELQGVFAVWQQGIADVLQEAIQRGDLVKSMRPDALAQFLLNSYEGALIRMKAEKSDKPLENFLHFAFDVLLKK
ncbi:TetR family transcriptional regulator C-terminal domain-containing protein [Tunturiibacter empetritectus]|uniref:TetR/AcrR family transcriptional repressor of nem operon n=1 Tax=Tunturiibacter lichenicola TaxID=2051959 RepID=A0A852VCY3_9BACT|nr:TetR/AcrR family transcriptional regulator [Edaphobacter lichenicola]NYF88135.1 TetR/AcrR family transcriptional repressor of nem operon [Edaphobacter lichenicola]